jgi:hypothetical protein
MRSQLPRIITATARPVAMVLLAMLLILVLLPALAAQASGMS